MATEAIKSALPELQTIQTATSIPVVNLVWTKTHDGYEKVKNSNALIKWYLSTTEATVNTVARLTLPIVERPLKAVDGLTSKGIDLLTTKVPSVKTPPEEIVSNTKSFVSEKAAAIGNFGLNTSNAILNNRVGLYLLGTVDKVAHAADETVAKYLPKPVDEPEVSKLLPEENNELAKTLNNVSGVVTTATKRLMRKSRTTAHINKLKKLGTTTSEKLKRTIEQVRKRTTEDENLVVSVRNIVQDLSTRVVDAAECFKDGLNEAQNNSLNAVRESIHAVTNVLEQTLRIKDLSEEAVDDLKKKIDYIHNTFVEVFTAAYSNWFKIPEHKVLAAIEKLQT